MTEKRIYNVNIKRATSGEAAARVFLVFAVLVGIIGFSKIWFGGSWIIDILALVMAFSCIYFLQPRAGTHVRMTPEQLQAWLTAGCPDDWGLRTGQSEDAKV